jgi:hypothetical protein
MILSQSSPWFYKLKLEMIWFCWVFYGDRFRKLKVSQL